MPAMQPSARLERATVALEDRVILRAIDLEVAPGITVLRGPNGAGKTTALRALAGLLPLLRGAREVAGELLYLGHRPQLLHGLSVRENLAFFMAFRGRGGDAAAAIARWGLAADADRPVERLSVGQRRRAALARLDAEPCDVIVLDEPFAELDQEGVGLVREALNAAVARGAAVLIASHAHPEIDRDAVRVYSIHDGALAGA